MFQSRLIKNTVVTCVSSGRSPRTDRCCRVQAVGSLSRGTKFLNHDKKTESTVQGYVRATRHNSELYGKQCRHRLRLDRQRRSYIAIAT